MLFLRKKVCLHTWHPLPLGFKVRQKLSITNLQVPFTKSKPGLQKTQAMAPKSIIWQLATDPLVHFGWLAYKYSGSKQLSFIICVRLIILENVIHDPK